MAYGTIRGPGVAVWNPTMGAPKNYDQWVAYHRQAGDFIANDQQRRDAYRAYAASHGLAQPWLTAQPAGPAAPAPEKPPSFNYLDAQGIAESANAQQRYDALMGVGGLPGSLADQRTQRLADIATGRINQELGYQDAMRASSRNASSRGLFNSGLRRFRDARNLSVLQRAMGNYDLAATQAENEYQRGTGQAASDLSLAQQTALSNSGNRNMEAWYRARGLA